MNDAERRDVIKVAVTCTVGSILILLVPLVFRLLG